MEPSLRSSQPDGAGFQNQTVNQMKGNKITGLLLPGRLLWAVFCTQAGYLESGSFSFSWFHLSSIIITKVYQKQCEFSKINFAHDKKFI